MVILDWATQPPGTAQFPTYWSGQAWTYSGGVFVAPELRYAVFGTWSVEPVVGGVWTVNEEA